MISKRDIEKQINEVVENNSMEVVEITTQRKNGALVEVFIYKEDGVTLDDCQFISRELEKLVDFDSYFEDSYNIIVSSPGLDRKLKTIDDYRRNKGKAVELTLYAAVNGKKEYTGNLIGYDDQNVLIETSDGEIELAQNKIASMRRYIEF